ncbi:hypothetical protein FA95DRAFT_1475075, partial [Auriscalpium vulgare]
IKPSLSIGEGQDRLIYKLKGIIYYGDAHFTSRIVADNGVLSYHDGIATGRNCVEEGRLTAIQDIYNVRGRQASVLIYSNI